jgi:hemerythrin
MEWSEKYELGHERIDFEHRIFLSLVTDIQKAASTGAEKEKVLRIMNEIRKYAEFHFVSEENVMTEHNYPDQEHHAAAHRLLLSELQQYYIQLSNDQIDTGKVFDFLFKWFALHTTTEDKKLVSYLKKN